MPPKRRKRSRQSSEKTTEVSEPESEPEPKPETEQAKKDTNSSKYPETSSGPKTKKTRTSKTPVSEPSTPEKGSSTGGSIAKAATAAAAAAAETATGGPDKKDTSSTNRAVKKSKLEADDDDDGHNRTNEVAKNLMQKAFVPVTGSRSSLASRTPGRRAPDLSKFTFKLPRIVFTENKRKKKVSLQRLSGLRF